MGCPSISPAVCRTPLRSVELRLQETALTRPTLHNLLSTGRDRPTILRLPLYLTFWRPRGMTPVESLAAQLLLQAVVPASSSPSRHGSRVQAFQVTALAMCLTSL